MLFSSLNLSPPLQQAIEECGYQQMTPIQEQAIVPARRGKDILACAQTGTGKTAAFALPILQQLADDLENTTNSSETSKKAAKGPTALILTPTRELAQQLATTIGRYANYLPIRISAVYGGVKIANQHNKLKAGVDVLIATPGRLLEHLSQCNVDLANVKHVAIDEADRMLDMGFVSDVMSILKVTSKQRQTLLFSATLSSAVNELAHKVLKNHQEIRANKANKTADTVEHVVYPVEERRKIELFLDLLEENNWFQVLVFTSTKQQADQLLQQLKQSRVTAAICHGDKSQGARRRALADFTSAKIQVLIATEVAARGLDIQGLEYVVNYNLPYLAEDYVHRVGRAGRAGSKGYAISFVSREEERTLETIQRVIGSKVKRVHHFAYEVSNREALVKKVSKQPRSIRSNKASSTTVNKPTASKKKTSVTKSKNTKNRKKKSK